MSRMSNFGSPFLLGFDEIERVLDRVTKGTGDGYPPYNIEKIETSHETETRLRITLAVAGFTSEQLEVTLEDSQLIISGQQEDQPGREFLHRGIAKRRFKRAFVLVDGFEVESADLRNGLLMIDLVRHQPKPQIRTITIKDHNQL